MLKLLLDWSELWALLIPILVYGFHKQQPRYMRPIIIYLFIALVLNLGAEVMAYFAIKYRPPKSAWWYSNNPIYNAQIVIRFIFFSLFFYLLNHAYRIWVRIGFALFLLAFIAIELYTNESVFDKMSINGSLQVVEAFFLMLLCIYFYLRVLTSRMEQPLLSKSFYQVTAIAVYCILTFFIFLYYKELKETSTADLIEIWDFHNGPFILSCIFTATALYVPARHTN